MPNNPESEIRIVVDAMGGDFAPHNVVAGALQSLHETKNRFHIILVGKEREIKHELHLAKAKNENFSVVHADETLDMSDSPTAVVKTKRNSSIAVGMFLQKEKKKPRHLSAREIPER